MRPVNVLIAGGGTGGHISPGVALYEEFKSRKVKTLFMAGTRDKKFSILGEIAREDLHYYPAPSFTKNILKLPLNILKFFISVYKSYKIMKGNKINAVIGMGGYASAPALFTAIIRKISIFLCEQNSVPGRVTLLFEKYSGRIYGTFEITKEYLKFRDKLLVTGNPIRNSIFVDLSESDSKKAFNLHHCRYIVLVLGGSQGAVKINELILGIKKEFKSDFKDVGFIWSTGDLSYGMFREQVQANFDQGSIYISPYIKNMGMAYKASDLVISRAGAGVMMEIAAMGKASILIPYPYSAMGHQDKNADVFVKAGASYKIENSKAVPGNAAPLIIRLLRNHRLLNNMSEKALMLSRRDSSKLIVNHITGTLSS